MHGTLLSSSKNLQERQKAKWLLVSEHTFQYFHSPGFEIFSLIITCLFRKVQSAPLTAGTNLILFQTQVAILI